MDSMEYGRAEMVEFLCETDPDSMPIEMDEFISMKAEEIRTAKDPADALRRILCRFFYGREWAPWRVMARQEERGIIPDAANPTHEWVSFDGYENVLSIREDELDAYLEAAIDHEEFREWMRAQREEEEEEEEE